MTIPRYGRVTPLQICVLKLAGEVLDPLLDTKPSADRRVEAMKKGLAALRERTGANFGFDLARWHEFLMNDERFRGEYAHPYGWNVTAKTIEATLKDGHRTRSSRSN